MQGEHGQLRPALCWQLCCRCCSAYSKWLLACYGGGQWSLEACRWGLLGYNDCSSQHLVSCKVVRSWLGHGSGVSRLIT